MRKLSKVLLLGIAAGSVCSLAACGNGESGTAAEKTFILGDTAYGGHGSGTNPHNEYDGWSTIRYGIGETLFKFNEKMELEPWLAKSYEFTDDTHIKIELKDNVTFSSGRKMDANAVKQCLEDLIAKHDRAPLDLNISKITTDGDYTVILETSEPSPAVINFLCDPYGCIIDMDSSTDNEMVIGTGPFIVTDIGDEMVLVKNEKYWNGDVKLDKVKIRAITDGTTLTNALQNGEVDATYGLPYASYDLFENNKDYKIQYAETSRQFFGKVNYRSEIMQDPAIRKAIPMAIDKDSFVNTLLKGHGATSIGPFPASSSYGDNTVTDDKYDPEGAKKILEDAGWIDSDGDGIREKNGKKLSIRWLTYPSRQELPLLAEAAHATLKNIGVDVQINCTDNSKAIWKEGAYDLYVSAMVTAPTGDPEYFFNTHTLTNSSSNYEKYSNPKLDALGEKLHMTFGSEERGKIATEMTQIILDDDAYFFVSHLKMGIVSKAGLSGFAPHPSDYYEITANTDITK